MENRRLKLNTYAALLYRAVTVLCNFVLPRMIIVTYGSAVNGLVGSISQFLGLISFLELGMGAVVQGELYAPLRRRDWQGISRVMAVGRKYFRVVLRCFLVYLLLLCVLFPYISHSAFDRLYTLTLLAAMSISLLVQYYCGMMDRLLLSADQRSYIPNLLLSGAQLLNVAVCCVLMRCGVSIQLLKLTTSLLFLLSPVVVRRYIRRHYSLQRSVPADKDALPQRWNGVAQHIAAVVLDGTDVAVLTVFSKIESVSVYSVYNMVTFGISQILSALTTGIQALWGFLWAGQERERLKEHFSLTEWLVHNTTVFLYGCTAVLLVPFVAVYTRGVTDMDYREPLFGLLLTLANAWRCLRQPYITMILAANEFKRPQRCFIVGAVMNLVLSVLTARRFGLVGVAVGTLAALVYQTVWMAAFCAGKLEITRIARFLRLLGTDALSCALCGTLCRVLSLTELMTLTYGAWAWLGIRVAGVWLAGLLAVNLLFYRSYISQLPERLRRFLRA